MRIALIGLFLLLVGAERQVVWAQESPQQVRPKIMPPVLIPPRLPPAFQQKRARTRIPSPFPRKPLDWSDFIYRSEQEKEFWEKLPDWSSIKEIASKPRDKNGEVLPNDTVPGYTGYAKWRDHSHRMIFRLENGWTIKEMTWYRSGEKTSQISYLDGKRNGPALTWHQRRFRRTPSPFRRIPSPQSKPTPTKQASEWKDQNKKSEGNYKDDKKHGLWNFYDYEGNKSYSHTYAEGIEEGLFLSWHKNGNKREEGNHKKGKKHGLWTEWYENGRKMREGNYVDGKRDGPWIEWYENGQMMREDTHHGESYVTKAFYNPEGGKFGDEIQENSALRDWTDLAIDISSRVDANGSAIKNSGAKGFDGYAYDDFYYEGEFAVYEVRNGWIVKILESWDYWEESSYRNGSLDGPYKNWYWSGAKAEEGIYENDLLKTASAWKPNGEKCPVTRVTAGSGQLVKYDQQGNKTELLTYAGGKKEGLFVQWHKNGRKKKEGSYGNEKLHGIEIHYYQDGNKSHIYTYKEGKKEGLFISWYKNGQKREEVTYAESLMRDENSVTKISPTLTIPRRSIPLRLASRFGPFKSWYENGILKTEGAYKRGNRDGTFSSWHSNGQKKEEGNYVDGKMDGLWIHYDQDGNKSHNYTYKEGKKEGPFVQWHENGQKETEGNYEDGQRIGHWIDWHENGQKETEGNYENGQQNGLSTFWYENGQKMRESNFKDGKLVSAVVWKPNGERCPETKIDQNGDGIIVSYDENGKTKMERQYDKGRFRFVPPWVYTRQNPSTPPNVSTPPKKVIRIPKPVAPKSEPTKMPDRTPNSNEIDFNSLPPPPPPPNILPPSAPPPKTKSTHGEN